MRRRICFLLGCMVFLLTISLASAADIVSKTNADGSTYTGWVVGDQADGFGIAAFADGDMYYGQWVGGRRNGFGVYLLNGGGMAAGFWTDDVQQGMGMQLWTDHLRYEGYFQNGQANGDGFLIDADGTMTAGQWSNGQIATVTSTALNCRVSSFTAQNLNNGDSYLGELVDGVIEGYGVYCFANGGYYVGQFHQGQFTGYGLYLEPQTGGYMAGSFENGMAQGYATSYYLDGTSYTSWMGSGAPAADMGEAPSTSDSLCETCRGMGWCPVCRSGNGTYSNYGFSSACSACSGSGKCWTCGGARIAN